MLEQQVGGHFVVAAVVIRRHKTFVAPKDVGAGPKRPLRVIGLAEALKERLGRAAAGESHEETAVLGNGRFRPGDE